jgi:ribosomal protein L11 methyltransferase
MSSTFRLTLGVPKQVNLLSGETFSREEFFAWIWREFQEDGLAGVHEGTFLSEQAFQSGHETESWTIDSAQAPKERDWVGSQEVLLADLYFYSLEAARGAREELSALKDLQIGEIGEQKAEDWDAQWKASFTGAEVSPFWHIVPPWVDTSVKKNGEIFLRINPGAGFGTGTHETTQLCLEALGEFARKRQGSLAGISALDFGSGSGILSIGFALLGGRVDAVEIDQLAIENSRENCALNGVEELVTHSEQLHSPLKKYDFLIANILRPVLIEFGVQLIDRLKPAAPVILSGLIESDVESISAHYSTLLGRKPSRVLAKNEWRAVIWD